MDSFDSIRCDVFEIAGASLGSLGAWRTRGERARAQRIYVDGQPVGSVWDDAIGRWCCLHDLMPKDLAARAGAQFRDVFERIRLGLGQAGMQPRHLVRTWFVLNPIVPTYVEFNRIRSDEFAAWGLDRSNMPASTAVGGNSGSRACIVAGVLALVPRCGQTRMAPAASPLQGAAVVYGSAFSRATAISSIARQHLFVSGTASIDPAGASLFPQDTARQVNHTLTVVDAILRANGFVWSDVANAIAYFKRREDEPLVETVRTRCPAARVHVAQADVCRDELWFELELEAERSTPA